MLGKIIGGIVLVVSLITGIWAIDDRYATGEELKKTEVKFDNKVKKTEIKLVETLENFKQNQIQDQLEQRYINLTDQLYQYKALITKNPNSPDLRKDFQNIETERTKVKQSYGNLVEICTAIKR